MRKLLESKHLSGERLFFDFLLGVVCLPLGAALVIVAAEGIIELYHEIGAKLFLVPLAITLLWITGHFLVGLFKTNQEDCPKCSYKHGNFFSEWRHKKRCLPEILSRVR